MQSIVGAQWELLGALARTDKWFRRHSRTQHAHINRGQHSTQMIVRARQAAFRTSTGSSRSGSRYSTRNGESTGPSGVKNVT